MTPEQETKLNHKLDIIIGCMRKLNLIDGEAPSNPKQIEAMVDRKLIAFEQKRQRRAKG